MAGSFKTRLTLWNVVILFVSMVVLALFVALATRQQAMVGIDRELRDRVSPIMRAAEGRGEQGGFGGQNIFSGMGGGPDQGGRGRWVDRFRQPPIPEAADEETKKIVAVRRPRVFGLDGVSLLDTGVEPWDQELLKASLKGEVGFVTVQFEGEDVRVLSAPVRRRGEIVGVVQSGSELRSIAALQRAQMGVFMVLVPATLLLASLGAWFLTRRALKPIEDLTNAARGISATNMNQRIIVEGDDEFGDLAEEFNGMVGRLHNSFEKQQALLEAQKQFTADASHELRTPLTRIKLVASSGREENPGEIGERFGVIEGAADHMAGLVDQLLTLARTDGGKVELKAMSVTAVLANAVALTGLGEDGRLKLELKDKRAMIEPGLLERAVVNLLSNAARHTPDDGEIRLVTEERDGLVWIEVRDSGEGIPAEHLPNLTKRFYRVDSARGTGTGGTGLGLAIVDQIARLHGGRFEISSEVGVGTVARIGVLVG